MDEPRTYRWVASHGSADEAADSYTRVTRRSRGTRRFLVTLWIIYSAVFFTLFTGVESPLARTGAAVGGGAVCIVLLLAVILPLGRTRHRRQFRRQLPPGLELTSQFAAEHVELGSPQTSVRVAYTGFESISREGNWVHARYVGSPITLVYPADLFPDRELARLTVILSTRPTGRLAASGASDAHNA